MCVVVCVCCGLFFVGVACCRLCVVVVVVVEVRVRLVCVVVCACASCVLSVLMMFACTFG